MGGSPPSRQAIVVQPWRVRFRSYLVARPSSGSSDHPISRRGNPCAHERENREAKEAWLASLSSNPYLRRCCQQVRTIQHSGPRRFSTAEDLVFSHLLRRSSPIVSVEELIAIAVPFADRTYLLAEFHHVTGSARFVSWPRRQPIAIRIAPLGEINPIR